jgi:transcriptional regulator with XRE-family HTH domain
VPKARPYHPAMAKSAARAVQRRLGSRIQTLRHARELTQDELSHRCGISQKYLSELERGEKTPSWETLVALAHRGFGIRLATLMYGIDEDIGTEAKRLDDLLAGRPDHVRYDVLQAVRLLLRAGEGSK